MLTAPALLLVAPFLVLGTLGTAALHADSIGATWARYRRPWTQRADYQPED